MSCAIIGNSGSGKTYLASKLSSPANEVVHLDKVFWTSSFGDTRRSTAEVSEFIDGYLQYEHIIVEGVYSDLIQPFFESVNDLIWLDLDIAECVARVKSRCCEEGSSVNDDFIEWVKSYHSRKDQTSSLAHESLFNSFTGRKYRLKSSQEVSEHVSNAEQDAADQPLTALSRNFNDDY